VYELQDVNKEIKKSLKKVGIENKSSGSYVLDNENIFLNLINECYKKKLVITDIRVGLKKYPWIKKYFWKLIEKNENNLTKKINNDLNGGYFIWIKKDAKINLPISSCLLISSDNYEQKVHNLIIAEEGSEAKILTGCTEHNYVNNAKHIGLTEIFLEKNAKLNFTMVHSWKEDAIVRPITRVELKEKSEFVNNYVCLTKVKDIKMNPKIICKGKNSKAISNSIIFSKKDSSIDIGTTIDLMGENSKGEIKSRVVGSGSSKTIVRGRLNGKNKCKGHMECNGILISKDASIHAIPELDAKNNKAELSHEASVGKINQKEIDYLMTRGLSKENATNLIISGFINANFLKLPKKIEKMISLVFKKHSNLTEKHII